MWGWIVAAVVVVAAGTFYFWPTLMQAPGPQNTEQNATSTSEAAGKPLAEQMSGNWKSNADAKFTREIRQDGVMIDRYEGDASAGINGSWSVVNPAQEEMLSSIAGSLGNVSVIKVVWEGGVETTYFKIDALSDASMAITDLSGAGGATVFMKI